MSADEPARLSRRKLLAAAGGGAVVLAAGGGFALGRLDDDGKPSSVVPFHGEHQAGIATAVQDRLMFASFDLTLSSRAELKELLRAWSDAAARMTEGRALAAASESAEAPPQDTGEALDLAAARLTVTFG